MAELTFPGQRQRTSRTGNPRPSPRPADPSVRPRGVAAIAAGLVAGIAYLVTLSVMGSVVDGDGMWNPFHRIAAMLMGPSAMENADAFNANVVFSALAVHAGLSMIYGLVMAFLIVEFSQESAPWVGAACGALLYVVNYYGFTGLYPWMIEMRGVVTFSAHVLFGGLVASCYWPLHEQQDAEAHLSAG
ncbi:hypothetical protein [Usitatibacter rugosus]|nr:hypothetical protein [Usitatibacter rugosus]